MPLEPYVSSYFISVERILFVSYLFDSLFLIKKKKDRLDKGFSASEFLQIGPDKSLLLGL